MIVSSQSYISFASHNVLIQPKVGLVGSCSFSKNCEIRSTVAKNVLEQILRDCFVGAYSFLNSGEYKSFNIGNYCMVGEGFKTLGAHDSDRLTTSTCTNSPSSVVKNFKTKTPIEGFPPVFVGHNVWIGSDVLIKNGMIIGHGAMIEDGSVLTKHVPPFAIVSGLPGKIVGLRYTAEQRQRMEKIQWWLYDWQNTELNWCELDECLDAMEQAINEGKVNKFSGCIQCLNLYSEESMLIQPSDLTWDKLFLSAFQTEDPNRLLASPSFNRNTLQV